MKVNEHDPRRTLERLRRAFRRAGKGIADQPFSEELTRTMTQRIKRILQRAEALGWIAPIEGPPTCGACYFKHSKDSGCFKGQA